MPLCLIEAPASFYAPSFPSPQVVPSEYGTHETPWFFLLPSYWRLSPPSPSSPGPSDNVEDGQAEADSVEGPPDVSIHPRRVAVRGLVKRYGDGNMAVKGLQLDMFEGHVTCLLGHNGAGTHFFQNPEFIKKRKCASEVQREWRGLYNWQLITIVANRVDCVQARPRRSRCSPASSPPPQAMPLSGATR